MGKDRAFDIPIIECDAEFHVINDMNRELLMKSFQVTPGELEILPGSYSSAAVDYNPFSLPLTIKTARAFDDFTAENVQNMFRQAMGLPPQFKLPPRRPTCEWIDDG